MTSGIYRPNTARVSSSLMTRIIETSGLAREVQNLPVSVFASMIREVGIEDAGELLALATTAQLVQAFDENLFANARPGDREVFDAGEFVTWLEVLLEAGDEAAARRFSELDEDFVAHALSSLVLVLDEDMLRWRMQSSEETTVRQVDKALESALTEELDGYIFVAKQRGDAGWDAAITLLLALDRDHRPLFERLLDRLSAVARGYIDDLEELTTALSEAESLADDVEAAREERRSEQGYVEPRAAQAFLKLARRPLTEDEISGTARDPLTRAYFRDLGRRHLAVSGTSIDDSSTRAAALFAVLQKAIGPATMPTPKALVSGEHSREFDVTRRLIEAIRYLTETELHTGDRRVEDLAYLANVLLAGADRDGQRLRPSEAAEAVLATVSFGAIIEANVRCGLVVDAAVTAQQLVDVLRARTADFLFRLASSRLAGASGGDAAKRGYLCSEEELREALDAKARFIVG